MYQRDFEKVHDLRETIRHMECQSMDMKSLQYLDGGTYNDVFWYTFPPNTRVAMRLSYYKTRTVQYIINLMQHEVGNFGYTYLTNKGKQNILTDPLIIKNNFATFTNMLCEKHICPHFVYQYGYKNCKGIVDLVQKNIRRDKGNKRFFERDFTKVSREYNNISFQEAFDTTLWDIIAEEARNLENGELRTAPFDVMSIVFQVIFSLAVMQHYLPTFRHNDLSPKNILIKRLHGKIHPLTYRLYRWNYKIKNVNVFAAIHDFDLSHADASVVRLDGRDMTDMNMRNDVIMGNKFQASTNVHARRINQTFNPSFDSHMFLFGLRASLRAKGIHEPAFEKLCNDLGMAEDSHYTDRVQPSLFPANILNHGYFDPIRSRADDAFDFGPREVALMVQLGAHRDKQDVFSVHKYAPPTLYLAKSQPVSNINKNTGMIRYMHKSNMDGSKLIPMQLLYGSMRMLMNPTDAAIIKIVCERKLAAFITEFANRYISGDAPRNCDSLLKRVDTWIKHPITPHEASPFIRTKELFALAKELGVPASKLEKRSSYGGVTIPVSRAKVCQLILAQSRNKMALS